jgi:hypothetical protein
MFWILLCHHSLNSTSTHCGKLAPYNPRLYQTSSPTNRKVDLPTENVIKQPFTVAFILVITIIFGHPPATVVAQSARLPDPKTNSPSDNDSNFQIDALISIGDSPEGNVTYKSSGITVLTPNTHNRLAKRFLEVASITKKEYSHLFGDLSQLNTTIILMNSDEFYRRTGTPSWTNAIFFRKKIIVPIEKARLLDDDTIVRSIRHELLHAVVYDLGNGKVPGWLDEGLAQWIEGSEHDALSNSLKSWLQKNTPLPLSILQGGFTKLESSMVPAAYGQSLFATKYLIKERGIRAIRKLLTSTSKGKTFSDSFKETTGYSVSDFEHNLTTSLTKWASAQKNHYISKQSPITKGH